MPPVRTPSRAAAPHRTAPRPIFSAAALLLVAWLAAAPQQPAAAAAASGAAKQDPCQLGNSLNSVICNRGRELPTCITHAWLTHDYPHGCDAAALDSIDWPQFTGDDQPLPSRPDSGDGLLELLRGAWANKTVVFDGDSMMEEQWAGTLCALRAHGLQPEHAHMCLPVARGARADSYDSDCPQLLPGLPPSAVDFFTRVRAVPHGLWSVAGGPPRISIFVAATGTLLVRKGYGEFLKSDFGELQKVSDVIISGYGLHYPQPKRKEFEADMASLTELGGAWHNRGDGRFYLKEVSAQHFIGSGAFASWDQAHKDNAANSAACTCAPMNSSVYSTNFVAQQNDLLHALAARHNVTVLPFYEATAHRVDLHIATHCIPGWALCGCDCTHFCYSGAFWRDVYATWRKVVERDVGALQQQQQQQHKGEAGVAGPGAEGGAAAAGGGAAAEGSGAGGTEGAAGSGGAGGGGAGGGGGGSQEQGLAQGGAQEKS